MIRENSSRRSSSSLSSLSPKGGRLNPLLSRLPLVALIAATSVATLAACSSDDDEPDSETQPLDTIDPTEVPGRDLPAAPDPAPAAPAPPMLLPPGSDATNGLALPDDILDWSVIGVVNIPGTDAAPGTLRVIVGNDIAVEAARSGDTNPWPDGSMISHYQWSPAPNPDSATTTAPDDFLRLTLMEKNSTEFAADGGWRYGVWQQATLQPPAAADFDRACVNCHMDSLPPESGKDYVFTIPGALPTQDAIEAAPVLANGVEMPAGILGWRVIGAASRENDAMNPSIRVIVGNDIAVEAARSGETNPWPDGSMLAHYVWVPGENAVAPNTINPVGFRGITLMQKDSVEYEADGGWAYGNWATPELTAPADPAFDRACVDCHTNTVADNDYVFTRPGVLPTEMFPATAL